MLMKTRKRKNILTETDKFLILLLCGSISLVSNDGFSITITTPLLLFCGEKNNSDIFI